MSEHIEIIKTYTKESVISKYISNGYWFRSIPSGVNISIANENIGI